MVEFSKWLPGSQRFPILAKRWTWPTPTPAATTERNAHSRSDVFHWTNSLSDTKPMFTLLLRTIGIACFAFWFGGFGFYVSIVVPIGTEVLGTAMDQGMITRRVTVWLNVFCGIAVLAMFLDLFWTWSQTSRSIRWALFGVNGLMLVLLIVLVWLHPMLDEMIDTESKPPRTQPDFTICTASICGRAPSSGWPVGSGCCFGFTNGFAAKRMGARQRFRTCPTGCPFVVWLEVFQWRSAAWFGASPLDAPPKTRASMLGSVSQVPVASSRPPCESDHGDGLPGSD